MGMVRQFRLHYCHRHGLGVGIQSVHFTPCTQGVLHKQLRGGEELTLVDMHRHLPKQEQYHLELVT